jgi:ABC-type lipoprotein export system ATPase subunit
MGAVISLRDVSFSGQGVRIIHNVTLDIEQGKTTALVGASGCGKSTLLKLCAGLLIPTSGNIFYKDRNMLELNRRESREFRRESAFVFQDSALWANQSLFQNLELPLKLHHPEMKAAQRRQRIQSVIGEVGYKRDLEVRPSALSMGEQKLIGFARALICRPGILFLDEWTESLDDTAANRLITLVKSRQTDNNTIIFVSHDLDIIREVAQEIILMVGGYAYLRITAAQLKEDSDLAALVERGME